jgi:hypothetical protein
VSTSLIKAIEHTGNRVTVHEGWRFTAYHQTLRVWAEGLWDMRNNLRKPADNPKFQAAYDALRGTPRDIAVGTVGLFGYDGFEQEEKENKHKPGWRRSWKARPDINAGAIAATRANMLYNIKRFIADHGCWPCMVYTDCLYYVSEKANPHAAIPGALTRQNSLGGYKHKWSIPINNEVQEILMEDSLAESRKIELLNDIAEWLGACHYEGCLEHPR